MGTAYGHGCDKASDSEERENGSLHSDREVCVVFVKVRVRKECIE